MPRNSWTSVLEEDESGGGPSPVELDLPPELERLRRERRELEARMDQLTGRTSTPVGDAPRYPVTPLAQRRTEDARWARRRDDLGITEGVRTRPGGHALPADSHRRHMAGRGEASEVEPSPPLRTQQRAILEPAGRVGDGSVLDEPLSGSLYRRLRIPGDAVKHRGAVPATLLTGDGMSPDLRSDRDEDPRSEPRLSGLADRFTELEDRFTALPDRFTDVDTPTAGAARRVEALTDRFTGLRSLRPLRDRFTERMDRRLRTRDRLGGRAAALTEDPPLRSARDRYEARREELLALGTGGSGDLDDRSMRGRVRALAQLRMKREREAADDARVQRARARAASGGEP